MKVRHLIPDAELCSLHPDASVLEATQAMVAAHCGSILIQDAKGKLLGIFTERDLMVRVVAKGLEPAKTKLSKVMTKDKLYTAHPDRLVTQVRREMRVLHIRHVPVIEDDKVVAVLSTRSLLRADFVESRDAAEAMDAYIRGDL